MQILFNVGDISITNFPSTGGCEDAYFTGNILPMLVYLASDAECGLKAPAIILSFYYMASNRGSYM